jgi:hypothetical protein
VAQPASEETCVTAMEKERISIASHNCQKLPPSNLNIYILFESIQNKFSYHKVSKGYSMEGQNISHQFKSQMEIARSSLLGCSISLSVPNVATQGLLIGDWL